MKTNPGGCSALLTEGRQESYQNNIEPLEPLRELLKTHGLNPSPATCWRWIKRGRNGVRLEVIRTNRLLSKKSWVSKFIDAIALIAPAIPAVATSSQIAARQRRALRDLSSD